MMKPKMRAVVARHQGPPHATARERRRWPWYETFGGSTMPRRLPPRLAACHRTAGRTLAPAAGLTVLALGIGHVPHIVAGILWTDRLFR